MTGRRVADIGQVHWPECNIYCNERGHWLLDRRVSMSESDERIVNDGDQDEAEYVDDGDQGEVPPPSYEDRDLPEDEDEEPDTAEDQPE